MLYFFQFKCFSGKGSVAFTVPWKSYMFYFFQFKCFSEMVSVRFRLLMGFIHGGVRNPD